jgi:hypothetical protein
MQQGVSGQPKRALAELSRCASEPARAARWHGLPAEEAADGAASTGLGELGVLSGHLVTGERRSWRERPR